MRGLPHVRRYVGFARAEGGTREHVLVAVSVTVLYRLADGLVRNVGMIGVCRWLQRSGA